MYEVLKLSDDLYQVHSTYSNVKAMEGSQLAVLTYMVFVLRFSPDELEYALMDMLNTCNNCAQFGVKRTFIYSYTKDLRKAG